MEYVSKYWPVPLTLILAVPLAFMVQLCVLATFERQLGTPVVIENLTGEPRVDYDTDVMPFLPCCSAVVYPFVGLGLYILITGCGGNRPRNVMLLREKSRMNRRQWVALAFALALPFALPAITLMYALVAMLRPA